eukprot:3673993-Rhodomonas_salina.1
MYRSDTVGAVLLDVEVSWRELESESSAPLTRENWKKAFPETVSEDSEEHATEGLGCRVHAGRPNDGSKEALVLVASVALLAEVSDDVIEDYGCVRGDDDLQVAVRFPHAAEECRVLTDARVVAFHDECVGAFRA